MTGKVVGVEMNGNNPMLILTTPAGQTRVELNRVVNVGMDDAKDNKEPKASPAPKVVDAAAALGSKPKAVETEPESSEPPGFSFGSGIQRGVGGI